MAMNLLQIVQEASRRTGINEIPSSAFLNPVEEVQRLVALATQVGRALAVFHPWQALIREQTFTSLAAEDQGDITVIADGFAYILDDTIWNRTLQWPIYGPLDPQAWQAIKGSFAAYPYSEYRIRGNRLLMLPAPTAGHTMAFEYVSRYWIQSAMQDRFMSDTDTPVFDDEVMVLGLVWAFKQAEGFTFDTFFSAYSDRFDLLISRDGGNRTISTSYPRSRQGYNVQPGNWLV
jgi:hypothetical protein